jgi:hypothetical protein
MKWDIKDAFRLTPATSKSLLASQLSKLKSVTSKQCSPSAYVPSAYVPQYYSTSALKPLTGYINAHLYTDISL